MKFPGVFFVLFSSLWGLAAAAQQKPAFKPAVAGWVQRSNENAQLVLQSDSKFAPETAARVGVEGLDGEIRDLKPGIFERERAATAEVVKQLEQRLSQEKDPLVRQDLEILIKAENENIKGSLLHEKYEIHYINVARLVY